MHDGNRVRKKVMVDLFEMVDKREIFIYNLRQQTEYTKY